MLHKKLFALLSALLFMALSSFAYDKLNWKSRTLTAGKASLTSDSYRVVRNLGIPNFSPEFRLPLQLIYDSGNKKIGIFGAAWNLPQLESRVFPKGKGSEWVTPWGEKIRFYQKDTDNENMLEIFKKEMHGRGCFAPFQDWDAKGKEGDWVIAGKKDKKGWSFTYRNSRLIHIASPAGRSVDFAYQGDKLRKVSQDGKELITLDYGKGNRVSEITVNGIKHSIGYKKLPYVTLPVAVQDKAKNFDRFMLTSVKRGTLTPVEYSYDSYGYLDKVVQGKFVDELKIAHETPSERISYLTKLADLRKRKKSTRRLTENRSNITGRIISDNFFKYSYRKKAVSLRNRAGQKASYDYDIKRGILTITDFAGRTTKTYYFRRYDVAYNGKIRQVRDAQGRVVVNYRYDKDLGKPIRVRDMADNEIYYHYDRNGNMTRVSRSPGFDGKDRQQLMRIRYNSSGDAVSFARLDSKGKPYQTTRISYNSKHEVTRVTNGETSTSVSYSTFGLPTQVTDTFLNSTSYRYDKYNRLEAMTSPNGVRTHYKYDSNGLISEIMRTCPKDAVKDTVKVGTQPPANSIGGEYMLSSLKVTYNAEGLPMSITDNQGRVKSYDRDEMGRIIKEQFPNNTAVAYQYTVTGQVSKVLDCRNNPIAFKWNDFGKVEQKKTAAGQFTDYVYDQYGLLKSIVSRYRKKDSVDRKIQYSYDEFDRLVAADYGDGRKKTFKYDSWGKLLKAVSTDGDKRRELVKHYDEFDRVVRTTEAVFVKDKPQSGTMKLYAYTPQGKRTRLKVVTYSRVGGKMTKQDIIYSKWKYNKFGQLVKIEKGNDNVEYLYDRKGRVLKRTANDMETYYTYTPLGQLETKSLGAPYDKKTAIATLKYTYATDGTISAREVNGVKQVYKYDKIGQLTAVLDASGKAVEQYTYDPAGNILKKDVSGKVTTYTYDKANQLVSSTVDGKTTNYEYDAAGRLTKEGDKAYSYVWLDKVLNITQNGKVTNSYSYGMDGQIATANISGKQESFIWDGLALLKRDTTEYVNEPAVTGGNPILANGKGLFNDMLGTTLGKYDGKKFIDNQRTNFGSGSESGFFTGKPHIAGLGYAFLFRNYRSELGKWQTADPLGYPDGWNNLAYCNNGVTNSIDWLGGATKSMTWIKTPGKWSSWSSWYEIGRSPDPANPWILWQQDRSRTNIVQDVTVNVDYVLTDQDSLDAWTNLGGSTAIGILGLASLSTPVGWTVVALCVVEGVAYNVFGQSGQPCNYSNWTYGTPYSKLEVESNIQTSYTKPE